MSVADTFTDAVTLILPHLINNESFKEDKLKIETPIMRQLDLIYDSYTGNAEETMAMCNIEPTDNALGHLGTGDDYINFQFITVMHEMNIPQNVRQSMFELDKSQKIKMIQQYNRHKSSIKKMTRGKNRKSLTAKNIKQTLDLNITQNQIPNRRRKLSAVISTKVVGYLKKVQKFRSHSDAPKVNTVVIHPKKEQQQSVQRTIFVDVEEFYNVWSFLSSDMLLQSILVFAGFDYKAVMKSGAYDNIFRNLLKWKHEQGLLVTAIDWNRLSQQLCELSEGLCAPLILDIKYYQDLPEFRHKPLQLYHIRHELLSEHPTNVNAIKEILYRSNPLNLNIYSSNSEETKGTTHEKELSECEIDSVLDEIERQYDDYDVRIQIL